MQILTETARHTSSPTSFVIIANRCIFIENCNALDTLHFLYPNRDSGSKPVMSALCQTFHLQLELFAASVTARQRVGLSVNMKRCACNLGDILTLRIFFKRWNPLIRLQLRQAEDLLLLFTRRHDVLWWKNQMNPCICTSSNILQ